MRVGVWFIAATGKLGVGVQHFTGFALRAGTCGENESEPQCVENTGKCMHLLTCRCLLARSTASARIKTMLKKLDP